MQDVTSAQKQLKLAIKHRAKCKKEFGPDHALTCNAENQVAFLRRYLSDLRMREHAEMWANGEFEND